MLSEDQPVEYILDAIDSVMSSQPQPKVLLFDIGGVCVSCDRLAHSTLLESRLISSR